MKDRSRQCSVLPSADSQEGPGPHVPSRQVTVRAYGGGEACLKSVKACCLRFVPLGQWGLQFG